MDFLLPKGNARSATKLTAKEFDKQESKDRKRSLLYLIESYLRDCNLQSSADTLANEAQLTNQYELCDNVDLEMIFQDYNAYYCAKFDKYPKVLRKSGVNINGGNISQTNSGTNLGTPQKNGKNLRKTRISQNTKPLERTEATKPSTSSPAAMQVSSGCDLQIDVTYLSDKKRTEIPDRDRDASPDKHRDNRRALLSLDALPTLCDFEGYSSEWREMADLITREIVTKKSATRWADCAGLERSVDLLKEAVVYPLAYPELFEGLLAPWKGILLYGPPGTGKTLLARALAAESPATFINLTISTFVSKWRGESEKMLKVLFDVARLYAPATIFIDELDALASKHEDNQHDATRRFRSELLIQLDGLLSADGVRVFVLATTNSPWNLCGAILRRFEKRILVNVPEQEGRADLFQYYFGKHPANEFARADYKDMANMTANFSGADIQLVCREVAMSALREKWATPNSNERIIKNDARIMKLRAPSMDDVRTALRKIRPTNTDEVLKKYKDWEKLHGCM